jgi:hypothetical protein
MGLKWGSTPFRGPLFSNFFDIARQKNYWLKNFASCPITNFGCSFGIQCPESGTVISVTFVAKCRVDDNAKLPGYAIQSK